MPRSSTAGEAALATIDRVSTANVAAPKRFAHWRDIFADIDRSMALEGEPEAFHGALTRLSAGDLQLMSVKSSPLISRSGDSTATEETCFSIQLVHSGRGQLRHAALLARCFGNPSGRGRRDRHRLATVRRRGDGCGRDRRRLRRRTMEQRGSRAWRRCDRAGDGADLAPRRREGARFPCPSTRGAPPGCRGADPGDAQGRRALRRSRELGNQCHDPRAARVRRRRSGADPRRDLGPAHARPRRRAGSLSGLHVPAPRGGQFPVGQPGRVALHPARAVGSLRLLARGCRGGGARVPPGRVPQRTCRHR